jgi:tetratricopeptide (TPR) repeat protein
VLIAETKNIELHFQPGTGDVLLITFASFAFKANGVKFWGDNLASNLGYPCIGFTDKSSTWYPEAEMRVLAERAEEYLSKYKTILAYGQSMGGYAVLKFAKLLRADFAISMSPQFSIKPADVPFDRRYHTYYDPTLHETMRIETGPTTCQAIIISDPWFLLDEEHVRLIRRASPSVITVPAYVTGHSTIDLFANTQRAGDLFKATLAGDAADISRQIRRANKMVPAVRSRAAVELTLEKNVARAEANLNRFEHNLKRDMALQLRRYIVQKYISLKDFKAAGRNALQGIMIAPEHAYLLELLSEILFATNEEKAAYVWLQRSILADQRRYTAHKRMGDYKVKIGDIPGAIESAKAAVEHSNSHPVMMHFLSEMYKRGGEIPLALQYAVEAADKAPSNVWLQIHAALLFLRTHNYAGAEIYLNRAQVCDYAKDQRVVQALDDLVLQISEMREAAGAVQGANVAA